jgi:hypothetical protein
MHPQHLPEVTGIAHRIRPRGSRRGLSLIVATALVGATLVAVTAPSASASGGASPHDITACTFDGKRHLDILLTPDGSDVSVDWVMQRPAADEYFYFWESWSFVDSSLGDYSQVDWRRDIASYGDLEYAWDATHAGSIWVWRLSRIANFDYEGTYGGDGPLDAVLCSLTIVFANADGSDPRPEPPATVGAPTTAVECAPLPAQPSATVTCTVTGGDPGISILWRASYNPVFAEAGVTLGADGLVLVRRAGSRTRAGGHG